MRVEGDKITKIDYTSHNISFTTLNIFTIVGSVYLLQVADFADLPPTKGCSCVTVNALCVLLYTRTYFLHTQIDTFTTALGGDTIS